MQGKRMNSDQLCQNMNNKKTYMYERLLVRVCIALVLKLFSSHKTCGNAWGRILTCVFLLVLFANNLVRYLM
jgi:hypothetical protein